MEQLYAELLLWYIGFHSSDKYNALLDAKFLREPQNEVYLDLETHSSDLLSSMGRFTRYWEYECEDFHSDLFGKQLFSGLKAIYDTNAIEISDFGNRCEKLWCVLPDSIRETEPFDTLGYAKEPLSWGDAAQTRQLYENAFAFYADGNTAQECSGTQQSNSKAGGSPRRILVDFGCIHDRIKEKVIGIRMPGVQKGHPDWDTAKVLDGVEAAVYALAKPYGFQKHGRTLHRFVSGDISQVIHFQLGQAHRKETHLLVVNVGIRVPECMNRQFRPDADLKKYYHEYDCNIRSRLGEIEGKEASCYDLRQPVAPITDDILRQIRTLVIPAFEILNSRDAILSRRRDYPTFDLVNRHLILLEEAMIYGRQGDPEKARETFCLYYHLSEKGSLAQKDPQTIQNHLLYLDALAAELGIDIP